MKLTANARTLPQHTETGSADGLQKSLHRWFIPREEVTVVNQQSRGVFLPYPLLAIMVTVGMLLLGGIIAIEVQLTSLSTTILLRDQDFRSQLHDVQEKNEQIMVYIHDMREKRVQDRAELDNLKEGKKKIQLGETDAR